VYKWGKNGESNTEGTFTTERNADSLCLEEFEMLTTREIELGDRPGGKEGIRG